ncbi:MFS transporter [Bengtsoniella intestinalis]|uniref:MFS transporter n=1 Tax=Bengtsoniella intestinalis TaxID=3073143 RepID=UPI00391F248C
MPSHWKANILTIWLGQSFSFLTSSVLQMAIIWHITQETGSAVMITYATLCGFMPQTILGPFTGVFIDRLPKKIVIILSDGAIALASLALGLVALYGNLPIWLIYMVLFIRSVGTAFHDPATQALTPLIVPKEHLTQYSGYYQAFDSICLVVSPALAIILYEYCSFHVIAFFDVAGALCASLLLLIVPLHEALPAKETLPKLDFIKETKEGFRVVRSYEGMVALMVLGAVYSLFYSPIGSLYPLMTMQYFNGSTAQSGLVEMVFSLGSLLGALLLGRLGSKLSKHKGLFCSIFFYGLTIALSGFLPNTLFLVFVATSFLTGITTPFFHGIVRALYQLTIPQEYLGRAFSLLLSVRRIGFPVGLLIGGQLADALGIQVLYQGSGILCILLALTAYHWPSLRVGCNK